MVPIERTNRREFLSSTVMVLSIGLAGCIGGGDGNDASNGSTPTATARQTASATASPTASSTPTATPRQKQVDMVNIDDCQESCFRFRPETLEIEVGMRVKWVNLGRKPHTVTAYEDRIPEEAEYFASGGFEGEQAARDGYWEEKKGIVDPGSPYTHLFEVPGEYDYFCVPHEELGPMVGTVNVL